MKRGIERRLSILEKRLNPDPSSVRAELVIYEAEEGIPEELLLDRSIPRILIPENHRDPDYVPIHKKECEQAVERARARLKAQNILLIQDGK